MSSSDIEWERKAVRSAIHQITNDPTINVSALARKIKKLTVRHYQAVVDALELSTADERKLHARLQDESDRSLRGTLEVIKNGGKPEGLNFAVITQYAKDDEAITILVNEKFEAIQLQEKYPEVGVIQTMLDYAGGNTFEGIHAMQGSYIVYRPYYFDFDNQVMRLKLTIGSNCDQFKVSLRHCYDPTKYSRAEADYTLEGVAVPLANQKRAVINLKGNKEEDDIKGNYMMLIDFMETARRRMQLFTGVALSAIGPSPSTAWPFYARRLRSGEVMEPNIIPLVDDEINADIERQLALGAVKWNGVY